MKRGGPYDWAFHKMPKSLRRVAERLPKGDPASKTLVEYTTLIHPFNKALETSVGLTTAPEDYEPPTVGLPTILCDEKVMVVEVESVQEWDDETQRMMTHHTIRLEAAE